MKGSFTKMNLENISSLLLYLRAAMLSLILLIISYYSYVYNAVSESLFLAVAILFGLTAISGFYLSSSKPGKYYVAAELFIHSLIVTIVIYNTGLIVSPWLVLYFPLVILATSLLNHKYGLFVALSSIACYALVIQNEIQNWYAIPLLDAPVTEFSHGVAIQTLALLSAMTLIAIGIGFLKKQIAYKDASLVYQEQKFIELVQEDATIMKNLDQGVIYLDQRKQTIRVNKSARLFLGIPEDLEVTYSFFQNNYPEISQSIKKKASSLVKDLNYKKLKIHIKFDEDAKSHVITIFDNTEFEKLKKQLESQNEMAVLRSGSVNQIKRHEFEEYFVARSQVMQDIFNTIKKVAESKASVLIVGESGTGKEVVANAIHKCSSRTAKPFVVVNCGAIPENLIESQLFGHRKGSFTGASSDSTGLFVQADGGTLFLDEIGELPIHLQAKLLRAIQTQKIRPIGSEEEIAVDVRILSATNRNLEEQISSKTFREDLYYRLNVVKISLPPLRDRKEDLIPLINFILNKLNPEGDTIVSPEVISLLEQYDYPGNIRELENILERALVLGGDAIIAENLPKVVSEYAGSQKVSNKADSESDTVAAQQNTFPDFIDDDFNLDQYLKDIEKSYLEAALEKTDGVKTKAAKVLGLNFRSFRYRLDKFDIDA